MTAEHIAFLVTNKLGDSLLLIPLARNLMRSSYRVTVFGRHAHALASWLPGLDVRPIPAEGLAALSQYDGLFQMGIDQPIAFEPFNCPLPFNSLTPWLQQQLPRPRLFLNELRHFAQQIMVLQTAPMIAARCAIRRSAGGRTASAS